MIDIRKKEASLKIAWVKRICENPDYVCPVLKKYCKIDLHLLLLCNIKAEDIAHCFVKSPPQFWFDVMYAWCEYNYKCACDAPAPRNEIIWYNSNIKIDNRVLGIKELIGKNVIHISDLLKEDDAFFSYTEFQDKYHSKITFVYYYGLIHAIPLTYKQRLFHHRNDISCMNKVLAADKAAKYVYNDLSPTTITVIY